MTGSPLFDQDAPAAHAAALLAGQLGYELGEVSQELADASLVYLNALRASWAAGQVVPCERSPNLDRRGRSKGKTA